MKKDNEKEKNDRDDSDRMTSEEFVGKIRNSYFVFE